MTHEIYTFLLCLVTFVLLTGVFTVLVTWLVRLKCQVIDSGLEDEKLKTEYLKEQAKKPSVIGKIFDKFVLFVCCSLLIVAFIFSLSVSAKEGKVANGVPTLSVVKSNSMSYVNEKNQYVKPSDVSDHLQMFDLIVCYKLPAEKDLKVNDIVIYQADDALIIHRIVAIEEPNDKHSERHFLLHGDANKSPDFFPVTYSQMKGIYTGNRIPMVGSFIMFLQSPSGYLCILLMVFAVISVPILEKHINKRIRIRLVYMGLIAEPDSEKTQSVIETETIPEIEDNVKENDETVVTFDEDIKIENLQEEQENVNVFLKDINECRTFREKLDNSIDAVKNRYNYVLSYVSRVEGISGIETADHQTFVHGSRSVCRMLFRGKTLCILLALEPEDYEGTKYLFTNITRSKVHSEFHMRLKLSSDRQAKWTCELLSDLFARLKFTLLDNPRQIPFVVEKIEEIQEQTIEEKIEEIAEEKRELENNNPFAHLKGLRDDRTFKERLKESSEQVKSRYETVTELLRRVDGVRVIDAKKTETFKKGNTPITKLTIKGKTLNAYLGLKPEEYENSKYIYTDESNVKAHANYPMRIKLSSDRQARWVNELITKLCAKNGLTLLEKPQEFEEILQVENQVVSPFAHLIGRETKTFKERLETSNEQVKARYELITELLNRIEGIRVIDSKKSETFKKGSVAIIKLTIKGKTLNAYIGLQPNDYVDSKYIYTDVSDVKAHANYPMRVRVTSDRQARWVNELVIDIANKNSLTILEKPVIKVAKEFSFADLKKKKIKGFKYRLRTLPIARERFDKIKEELSKIEGIRKIDSKSSVTYKIKSTPIVKFTIRGKTLNAYIGLNPNEYLDTKYIFTDVSNVKAYANYPMRVKVTSDRQVKWVNELINLIIGGVK